MDGVSLYSRNICISTNTSCNLNCKYCYEKKKSGKAFDVEAALNILRPILTERTANGTKIKLHGGEPFLEFVKIRQLCERLWNEQFNETYLIHITTNGTLVHGKIQEWLKEHKNHVILKLSLDGAEFSHEINRPNSFNKIDIPFFINTWPDLRVNMTLTPDTLPYVDINIKYLHSLGIKSILVNFAALTDWSSCHLEKIFYKKLLNIAEFYLTNPSIRPANIFGFDISRTLNKLQTFYAPCNIGTKTAYDLDSKRYYPCHMFFPSVCGSQLNELAKIDFTKREGLVSKECRCCLFLNICRTCYAENFIVRGTVAERDMDLCIYQKIAFVVLFKYEYARILSTPNPTNKDYEKMEAIYKWQEEIKKIEIELTYG